MSTATLHPTTGTTTSAPYGLSPANPYTRGSVEYYAFEQGAGLGREHFTAGSIVPREGVLSGEWADEPTPRSVTVAAWIATGTPRNQAERHATAEAEDDDTSVADAFEAGYVEAFPAPRMSYDTSVSVDASGIYHVSVETAWTLSENDERAVYNLGTYWDSIRATARRAMRKAMTERGDLRTENGGYRVRLEVEHTMDPRGRHYGSGLSNGVAFTEK